MGFDVGSIKSSEILDLCLFQYMLHDIYIYIYGGGVLLFGLVFTFAFALA